MFDIIISNPPYNNDMYLDFVKAGYDLLKDDGQMVMITPAKWYAKGGKKNEDFRATIVPHMKEIHVYKHCGDIFEIGEQGGISYYSIFKNKTFDTKLIQQHSLAPEGKVLAFKTELEEHTERPLELMSLKCLTILQKIKSHSKRLFDLSAIDNPVRKMYYCSDTQKADIDQSNSNCYALMSGVSGKLIQQGYIKQSTLNTTANVEKYKVLINEQFSGGSGKSGLLGATGTSTLGLSASTYIGPYEINKGSYINLYFADTELEAQSVCSFLNSKLIGFVAILTLISGKGNVRENWRHVPALPAGYSFDHIYTNEEIFDIFGLTSDEQDLINNLIKDRKPK